MHTKCKNCYKDLSIHKPSETTGLFTRVKPFFVEASRFLSNSFFSLPSVICSFPFKHFTGYVRNRAVIFSTADFLCWYIVCFTFFLFYFDNICIFALNLGPSSPLTCLTSQVLRRGFTIITNPPPKQPQKYGRQIHIRGTSQL